MLIRVIDVETTGTLPVDGDKTHGVCEIGFADVRRGDGGDWVQYLDRYGLVDPGCPIPPETSAIHHIVDEDVLGSTPWREYAATVLASPINIFAAHNAKFERLWLEDFAQGRPWICTYKCALRLWPAAPSHSNQALRYWRKPEGLDRNIAKVAHRAGPDAYVTAFLLRDMLALAQIEDLITWSSEPALQVRCYIGKWRGTPWREVDYGFLEWVSQRDFDEDVLFTVRHEMKRRDDEWRRQNQSAGEIA